jgi:hypothetical protein
MGDPVQPNTKLIDARMRIKSPTGSGNPMSRQELAEQVNAWQWRVYKKEDRLDETDVGRLERGETHWPGRTRREGYRAVLGAETDADLGFYRYRKSRSTRLPARPADASERDNQADATTGRAALTTVIEDEADRGTAEVDLVEFALALDQRGISNSQLTALELACVRLDQDFAQTAPDQAMAKTRLLITYVSDQLRQPQTLRHHERLVRLAARLAGLRAWACFDLDDHGSADRWYEAAVSAAEEAKAWGLGAWLLGAQSLIPWHRRELGRVAELIDRGIYFAGQGSDATTRAWLYALQARACAGMRNEDGFDTAYAMAEEAAEHSSERDRRHGMDFAHGTLDLRYYCGTSRLLLRQPQQARTELAGSLAALPQSHTKARAVLSLFLADAAVQSGDVSQASALTQHALASTINQPIVPILQQGRRIRRLVQQRDPAAGEGLNDVVQQFGNALAAVASRAKS